MVLRPSYRATSQDCGPNQVPLGIAANVEERARYTGVRATWAQVSSL